MSKIKSIVAAAAFVLSLPTITGAAERAEGQAPTLDPRAFPNMTQIYVASGVRDDGGGPTVVLGTELDEVTAEATSQADKRLAQAIYAAAHEQGGPLAPAADDEPAPAADRPVGLGMERRVSGLLEG